jgi:hypothetical protein
VFLYCHNWRNWRKGTARSGACDLIFFLFPEASSCKYLGVILRSDLSWADQLFYYLVCEAIGTAATRGLLCQPRVIVKMIVEKQIECRLAGETEVLGEKLPQRHFCPSQNPTWPDPGLNPGRGGRKPATNRLSYGAAWADQVNYTVKKALKTLHFKMRILKNENRNTKSLTYVRFLNTGRRAAILTG